MSFPYDRAETKVGRASEFHGHARDLAFAMHSTEWASKGSGLREGLRGAYAKPTGGEGSLDTSLLTSQNLGKAGATARNHSGWTEGKDGRWLDPSPSCPPTPNELVWGGRRERGGKGWVGGGKGRDRKREWERVKRERKCE